MAAATPATTSKTSALLSMFALCVSLTLAPLVHGNSEGDALYTLRRSLSDPNNVLQSWDPTLMFYFFEFGPLSARFDLIELSCTLWRLDSIRPFTVGIRDLGNSNLSGYLVPELGKLEHLQYLELYKNNIQGTIPVQLGNLKGLISLDLYNNNISGTIPPLLGKLKSLVFLRLNDNRLTGPVPRELVALRTTLDSKVQNCWGLPVTTQTAHEGGCVKVLKILTPLWVRSEKLSWGFYYPLTFECFDTNDMRNGNQNRRNQTPPRRAAAATSNPCKSVRMAAATETGITPIEGQTEKLWPLEVLSFSELRPESVPSSSGVGSRKMLIKTRLDEGFLMSREMSKMDAGILAGDWWLCTGMGEERE
ncbi:hypothetical protein L484_022519 [Morus notabilis]|uniref:Uncharacterized protein n=1 Tax=Morus notabilis TaxID=981085 RepID=W9R523_9ROSA|nr:hypothetical protein L484_022519 [Morus notabilis]